MSRPDDIPQDVWDIAAPDYHRLLDAEPVTTDSISIIARAILAERERCAKIADEYAAIWAGARDAAEGTFRSGSAREIAAAIRKGGE